MLKKKISIPFVDQVADKDSVSEFRLSQDLFKMKQQLIQSVKSEKIDGNVSKSTILLEKKRSKKSLKTSSPNSFQTSFLNHNKLGLQKVLENQRVKCLTKNFANKIKRNITVSTPIQFQPYIKDFKQNILNKDGVLIPNWFDLSFAFLSIIQIIILCFVYTLSLVFDKFIDQNVIETLQTFSMCFYTIEIIINFVSIKTVDGRKITILKQIIIHYIKSKFIIDILCLVILVLDINTQFIITKYFRLCVVLKIKECLQKLQKIQNVFINNFYKQQYWSLAKVFIVNFAFAHVLAVLLLAMASLSQNSNWLIKLGVQNAPWYQLYSWSYYWGTTIMLTVGFGDISATNYKQAICITFIETFSCILLAYNINCVGNLITNIRSQDLQKLKNFRVLRKLQQKNEINVQLQEKVCNFINESDKMKKQFGFEDQRNFISNLPTQLKTEFIKQSNIKIFKGIGFFRNFTQKTLLSLAQKLQVKIAHPQQTIFRSQEEQPQILILKQGKIGYCTKLNGSDYSGTVINALQIKNKESPKLIYLGFLTQTSRSIKLKIKSLNYSMVYFIDVAKMVNIMKSFPSDFQTYCYMKDKSKHVVDQFETIPCQYCTTCHTKMTCPKLHYVPISQIIIYKNLQNVKNSKNERMLFQRFKYRESTNSNSPLKLICYFQKISQKLYKNKNKNLKKEDGKKEELQEKKPKRSKLRSRISMDQKQSNFQLQNSFLLEHILEIINSQSKQIQSFQSQQFSWDVQADVAHNYKFYFPECNSSELHIKTVKIQENSSKCFPQLIKFMTDQVLIK